MSDFTTADAEIAAQLHDTGRTCSACSKPVLSWLDDADGTERTDKAVSVSCGTPRCFTARQPLLGLGLYAQTVEQLLARIGARGDPPK